MMFFSETSWNKGGAGRSRVRKRKGVVVDLISKRGFPKRVSESA